MAEPDRNAAKEKFLGFLEAKNLRITAQRRAIVDTVFGTDQHFTAEQLLGREVLVSAKNRVDDRTPVGSFAGIFWLI